MLVIACSLALLVIYAGANLLMRVKAEQPGRFYKYVSWFLITVGFLLVLSTGALLGASCCMQPACQHGHGCCLHQKMHHPGSASRMWHHKNCLREKASQACGGHPAAGINQHFHETDRWTLCRNACCSDSGIVSAKACPMDSLP